VLHIRQAMWGSLSEANTQPFARAWGRRDWLFAHAGSLLARPELERHATFEPVGSTDTELLFCELMNRFAEAGWHSVGDLDLGTIACSGSTASSTTRGFGSETKAAGAANNVPVIDLTKLSADLYTTSGLCPNNADYTSTTSKVGQFFCDDHTHFEALGAKQIAQMVAKALKDQSIGLAAYLKN
ncbi:MAG TPA: class II glutamine amidotransferase, partial [Polyangia bacterium]